MNDRPDSDGEPLQASEIQRRSISGSLWTGIHTIVSVPAAFLANAVVARTLGVLDYGELALLTVTLTLAMQFANFGFSSALIQWGSAAEARGSRRDVDRLLQRSLGFHVLVELPVLVVVAAVLTRGESWWIAAAVLAGVSLPCAFSGAALSVTIENRTAAGARLAILTNLITQTAVVIVAVVTGSATAVWATRTVVAGLTVGLTLLLLSESRRRTVLRPMLPRNFGKTFWRFAGLTWVAGLVGLLVYSRSEIFLLKAFDQNAALGVFALAFGLSQQITAPADSMLHALLPAVSGLLSTWPERVGAAFERATRVSALACGAIVASLVPALVFLVPLIYGASFRLAAWLLVPLALVSCFQTVTNPVIAFVNARRRAGIILVANTAGLVVGVLVAVVFIPSAGAWGAVAGNVAGQLVALVAMAGREPLISSRRLGSLITLYLPFLLALLASAAGIAAGVALEHRSTLLGALGAACLGSVAYVLLLRISKSGLTMEDRDALVGSVSERLGSRLAWLLRPITVTSL